MRVAAAAAARGESPPPLPAAYVYSGPGAGTRSVLSTLHSLRDALVPAVEVASLDAAQLLAGGWQDGCLLLVMPGGADLPYCKHLNGRGNALIREYVESGGSYMGLCAGAYYACARVRFEPGTRLEVGGDRELAFFPGQAVGSIYSGFCYESEDGAVAAALRFRTTAGSGSGGWAGAGPAREQRQGQLHAGGTAGAAAADGAGVAAADALAGGKPAVWAECPAPSTAPGFPAAAQSGPLAAGESQLAGGSGRSSGTSGTSSSMEWKECVDYVNGGPSFQLLDGSAVGPLLVQQQSLLQQLSSSGGLDAQQLKQQQQQPQGQQSQQLPGVEVLATYPEHAGAAAALLCWVGSSGGRAVLCSSHPELHPSWLSGQALPPRQSSRNGSSRGGGSCGSGSQNQRVSKVTGCLQQQLQAGDGKDLEGGRGSSSPSSKPQAAAAAAVGVDVHSSRQSPPSVDTTASRAAAAGALAATLSAPGHVQQLQTALLEGQQQRWRFWRSLLLAAGLEPWIRD